MAFRDRGGVDRGLSWILSRGSLGGRHPGAPGWNPTDAGIAPTCGVLAGWVIPLRHARDAAAPFRALPHDLLPASTRVDFLHLLAVGKPALRVKVAELVLQPLRRWSAAYGYGYAVDDDGYCCVATSEVLARHVLEVDRRVEPHEVELGLLLGYPRCCCEMIAQVGESRIDEQVVVVAGWDFEGPFRLIDPSGYRRGASLVCHLPCTPTCKASLRLARRAARFLRRRLSEGDFVTWSGWAGQL